MKKKVIILGSLGMLGQELVRAFSSDQKYEVTAWDKDDVDIANFSNLEEKLVQLHPEILINAAAYNAVDQCETSAEEYEKALLLNGRVPGFLADWSVKNRVIFVHYSTDYVFDGMNEAGYPEDTEPKPVSRYGESKFQGEKAVLQASGSYYVIRLSKLFGKPALSSIGKKSFFEVMLEKGRAEKEVRVVDDERSCFTYAPDLARATRRLIEESAPYGIYHLPNEEGATWYEAVKELYREVGFTTQVVAVSSDAFPRPAKRPHVSVLLNTKQPKQRSYKEALKEFLQAIEK